MNRNLTTMVVFIELLIFIGTPFWTFSEENSRKNQQEIDTLMHKAAEFYTREEYAEAIACYRQAADRGNAWAQNNLAWIYATFKMPEYRDGSQAVYYALNATAQEPKNSHFFRTLAAAYARVGKFEKAIVAQEQAIALLPDDKVFPEDAKRQLLEDNYKKLDLYKTQQAYVDKN